MGIDILQIARSKTRRAILELFFTHPEEEFYLMQIASLAGYSAGNIRREILKLAESGLFVTRSLGKMKLYKIDVTHPLYEEIKSIINKTIGIEARLRKIVNCYKEIEAAFLYGSLAKGNEKAFSDIDILIIGDVQPKRIRKDLYEYQAEIGREINSIVYSKEEFLDKVGDKNHFLNAIIKSPKVFLKGDNDEFGRFTQVRKAADT